MPISPTSADPGPVKIWWSEEDGTYLGKVRVLVRLPTGRNDWVLVNVSGDTIVEVAEAIATAIAELIG